MKSLGNRTCATRFQVAASSSSCHQATCAIVHAGPIVDQVASNKLSVRINLNLPNRRLFDGFEARVELAKVFRKHRPKVVLGFGGKTVLASPDHYQAMLITDAAVFYSRLTKWDEHFDGLPVHTIANQLSFPIALHGLDLPEASGYIVADISSTLGLKL